MRHGTWRYAARSRDARGLPIQAALVSVCCFAALGACARAPAPAREQPATAAVFTDTAVHRRHCETTDSLRVDLSKCVLKDQGRDQPRPPPLIR